MAGAIEIPDPGVDIGVEAGESAALQRWARFRDEALDNYANDRDRPDKEGTSQMSAHLKFGTIHPRTMVADLDARRTGHAAYLRELEFRDFYASVLYHRPDSSWSTGIPTSTGWTSTPTRLPRKCSKHGKPVEPASRLWTRACGSCAKWADARSGSDDHGVVPRLRPSSALAVGRAVIPGSANRRRRGHNQRGWQWCAGSGTDAAPYFRVFNKTTQGEKFGPTGDYIRRAGYLSSPASTTCTPSGAPVRPAIPDPIVDHADERQEALRRYGRIERAT